MAEKIVLIDGHSILNRAFYGVPDLTNSEGIHTNAVYGFLNILFKILEEEKPSFLTVAFDVKKPTFRHEMYAEYKGTRKGMPDELREQVPLIKEALQAMNIRIIEAPGFEADDVLGTIARKAEKEGLKVSLISGDRDLLQLATENIMIRIPKTKKGVTEIENYNTKDVLDHYQITPLQIIDLKGLMGDTSDNIPGLPGVGEKTAVKILTSFGSVENAYQHLNEVTPNKAREALKEHYDLAVLSKKLATIKTDCSLQYSFSEAVLSELFTDVAYRFFKRMEFKNFLSKFSFEKKEEAIRYVYRIAETLDEAELEWKTLRKNTKETYIGLQTVQEEGILRGVSLSAKEEEAIWIPVQGFISVDFLIEQIRQMLKEGYHFATFDLKKQLELLKVEETTQILDLGLAAYLLNPLKDSYLCDDIARDYCKEMIPSKNDVYGKHNFTQVSEENGEELFHYLGNLGRIAFKAANVLLNELERANMKSLYFDLELPLVYTLFDMEQRGILVDKGALQTYSAQLGERIVVLEKEIYYLAGEKFNINSPKQLGVILFEKLHLPFGKKTKTGYSTSADILEKLKCEDPIVSLILEYRQLTKLKSTYADGLTGFISETDGRIHGTFQQTITATGRLSCTEPNLQNIPIRMELGRAIRMVFIPKEGYLFLDADYSQIELRVLAHLSEDPRLIAAYQEAEDIHRITASQVFHTPLEKVTPAQRSNAKAVNFGIIYGISSFGLGQDLNITRKEAETYMKQYFETYPQVKGFMESLVEEGNKKGSVRTLYHRLRPVPELTSSNFMQRSFGERVAMNSPIQGTAADIIKIAMLRVNRRLKESALESKLILQIHDELLIETKESEQQAVKEILTEEMKGAAQLQVPLEVDVKSGKTWYEAK